MGVHFFACTPVVQIGAYSIYLTEEGLRLKCWLAVVVLVEARLKESVDNKINRDNRPNDVEEVVAAFYVRKTR